jgi:hypothetical protein
MHTRPSGILAVLAVASTLVGCASGIDRLAGDTPLERYSSYAGEPVERFTAFNVNGWTALSRNKLVVWTGVSDAYLLTVWDTCRDLQFVERIRITQTGSSISRLDKVIVRGDRCPITEIRPVDIKQMRADREAAKPAAGERR